MTISERVNKIWTIFVQASIIFLSENGGGAGIPAAPTYILSSLMYFHGYFCKEQVSSNALLQKLLNSIPSLNLNDFQNSWILLESSCKKKIK